MFEGVKTLAMAAVTAASGFFSPAVDLDTVLVPAGTAVLGGAGHSSMSGPAKFNLPAYRIDRYEVSNARYREFIKATGRDLPVFADIPELSKPEQPVTGVSWDDANAYCRWAGGRLPSEEEWEKAARGDDGRVYPWGNEEKLSNAYLKGEIPAAIGSHRLDVSPYGVYDMAGNVSEWVSDFRIAGNVCLPGLTLPDTANLQMRAYLRGNNFEGLPHMTRLHHRLWDYSDTVSEFFGFRCVYPEK